VSVSISLGVAGLDEWGSLTLDELLKRADEALYQSKRNGRDRVIVSGVLTKRNDQRERIA